MSEKNLYNKMSSNKNLRMFVSNMCNLRNTVRKTQWTTLKYRSEKNLSSATSQKNRVDDHYNNPIWKEIKDKCVLNGGTHGLFNWDNLLREESCRDPKNFGTIYYFTSLYRLPYFRTKIRKKIETLNLLINLRNTNMLNVSEKMRKQLTK